MKINTVDMIGQYNTITRLSTITDTCSFATTDQDAGKDDSVDLTANHGQIVRIRLWANFTAGQQTAWTALINDGTGFDNDDTSLAYDNSSGSVAVGDYLIMGDEIVYNSNGTSTPLTLTRAKKGTIGAYHDDNEQIRKANDGIRLELYPNSSRNPEEMFFQWRGIMTGYFNTDAAISAGAYLVTLDTSPAVLSDFGYGDLILIDDTVDEISRVQSIYGDMIDAVYDNAITTLDALSAHDNNKDVYRICEFDVPITFKFDSSGTTLYYRIHIDEKIASTVTVNLELIVDKYA